MKQVQDAYIVAATRTPIGRSHRGFFRNMRPDDLLATTLKAALAAAPGLDPAAIEDIICGCAIPEAQQGLNVARIGAVLAGLPTSVGGITVNRFCASGLSAVQMAADRIRVGEAEVMIAAGVESMSMVPMMGNAPSLSPSASEKVYAAVMVWPTSAVPETETPHDSPSLENNQKDADAPANVLDAAASGAASGMQLALNVGAMLLAFIALIALLNGILSGVGGWFNYPDLSLQLILGWVFSPLAWVIGVPWSEATVAGSFIGQKLVINEFVAYMNFGEYLKADADVAAAGLQVISNHTKAIISFALCGFANLSSIAILIGGLGSMAPNRRQEIAQLGLKAVAAGTLSNLMSATIAGVFLAL